MTKQHHRTITVLSISGHDPACFVDIPDTLDALRALIDGGWLEAITGPDWSAYVDEEGLIKGLPENVEASILAARLGWPAGALVGPAIFLGPANERGEETSIVPGVALMAALVGFVDYRVTHKLLAKLAR